MPDPKQSDDKGVNQSGQGVAQPKDANRLDAITPRTDDAAKADDEPGAASAGPTAGAEEDTYD